MKIYSVVVAVGLACVFGTAGCSSSKVESPPAMEPERTNTDVELVIKSTPSSASVTLSSGEKCTTPCRLQKSTSENFTVTVSKRDYRSATVKVSSNLQALKEYNRRSGASQAVIENLKVDQVRLTPNPIEVTLEPEWTR